MKNELGNMKNEELLINKGLPYIMHIDLNSCFAIIEQQANRLLRGRPVGVSAYDTPRGFVLAASYEAKAQGIKLGVNVEQARSMCPGIVIMTPDPAKYREAHRLFKELMLEYTPDVVPKSIDEFVLNLSSSPVLRNTISEIRKNVATHNSSFIIQDSDSDERSIHNKAMTDIALDIKKRIAESLGEWVTVNIGISTNRFLAKYAAGFDKPDGMTLIDHTNLRYFYGHNPYICASLGAHARSVTKGIKIPRVEHRSEQAQNSQETSGVFVSDKKQTGRCSGCGGMQLIDLPGINTRYRARLRKAQIYTPIDFLEADLGVLKKQVFKSIVGYYWFLRLRGHEIDDYESTMAQIGHQHAIKYKTTDMQTLERILMKLCEKAGRRLRKNELFATGIHLYIGFLSDEIEPGEAVGFENMYRLKSWAHGEKVYHRLYNTQDIYQATKKLLHSAEISNRVRILSVHVFGLQPWHPEQLSIFDVAKEQPGVKSGKSQQLQRIDSNFRSQEASKRISDHIDQINNRYGEFIVTPALMMEMQGEVLDRIAFGQVRDV